MHSYSLMAGVQEMCEGKYLSYCMYCIEGTEMRQLSCKVRRLLFLKRY